MITGPRYERIGKKKYRVLEPYIYFDSVTGECKTVPQGMESDGATGALDVYTKGGAWIIHDAICEDPFWDSGAPIDAKTAARVLSDVLKANGRWFRARTWRWATFLFGCHKTREHGWW